MFLKLSRFFIILFVLFSFITQSFGESGILFRITPPDIAGALAIGFYILSGRWFKFKKHWYISTFIVALLIGGLIGLNITQSLIEILILLFLFMLFMVLIAHFKTEDGLKELIYYFAWAGLLASVFGVYDFVSGFIGTPRIFPARTQGEILSGFRNAGQAGAYALVVLTVLIPVRVSKLFDFFNKKEKKIIRISLVSTIIFLLLTGKIAAYIGFAAGIIIFFFLQRNLRAFYVSLIVTVLFLLVYNNLDSIAPEIYKRITGKYESRIGVIIRGEKEFAEEGSFFGENIKNAFQAFYDNPLSGSGIGAFSKNYDKYEVHSTYLKMVGEAGLIGIAAYIILMISFLKNLKYRNRKYPLNEFLYYLFPFLIGCLISWSYTYHLRKREFWIMFAIVYIINLLIKKYRKEMKVKTKFKPVYEIADEKIS